MPDILETINLIPSLSHVREPKSLPIRAALTHSFAFGGHNAGLIFKRFS
jgi:3-oxoacyl-(acyl-carrier-protein) synthase